MVKKFMGIEIEERNYQDMYRDYLDKYRIERRENLDNKLSVQTTRLGNKIFIALLAFVGLISIQFPNFIEPLFFFGFIFIVYIFDSINEALKYKRLKVKVQEEKDKINPWKQNNED